MAGGKQTGRLMLLVMLASLNGVAGGGEASTSALGVMLGNSSVRLNHQLVNPGTVVFFAGDVVETGKGSGAVMRFRSGASATLAENSEILLAGNSGQADLDLRRGAVAVRADGARSFRVNLPGASVTVQKEGEFPALCRMAAVGRAAAIFNDHGRVEIHGAGAPLILRPGQSAHLEAGWPQAPGQVAGKVSAEMPSATVQHAGQTQEIDLNVQDALNWEDLVKTLKQGRVRIAMLDGSFLNVGARSQMRITKHDPTTQQTQVELTVGRMRGEVVKLTKPGASFQVRTQTAVIGVVGTVFVILATPDSTQIWCIEGTLTVQSIVAGIVKTVQLNAGQSTVVPRDGPPSNPVTASPSQIQNVMNLTEVGPGVTAAISPGLALGTIGTGAAASGITGVTITRLNSANDSLGSANTNLGTATGDSNAATSAANGAGSAANGVVNGIGTIYGIIVSPSNPCGCQ